MIARLAFAFLIFIGIAGSAPRADARETVQFNSGYPRGSVVVMLVEETADSRSTEAQVVSQA